MRARLLGHVQRLVIAPYLQESTQMDEEASEPYAGEQYGPEILVRVQLDPTMAGGRKPGQGGPTTGNAYTATALAREVAALRYTPRNGDRVSEILEPGQVKGEGEAVELYVGRVRPSARTHFGRETWVLELEDRSPGRAPSSATS